MAPLAFINYRRSDSQHAAINLRDTLNARFGEGSAFLDVGDIDPGSKWPDRLRDALDRADVLLVVIGPGWLAAHDKYGRRRLDLDDDWVRLEIVHAIGAGKPIIPILVSGERALPPAEGLPSPLVPFLSRQSISLRDDFWPHDVGAILDVLVANHGFISSERETSPVSIWPALPASIDSYQQRLAHETSSLALLGMGRGLQIDLPISEAYVPLRTMLARSMEIRGTDVFKSGHAEHEEDVDLGSVFHKAAHLGLRAVILLGEPGSGKTTGARQMAWRLASRRSTPQELGLPAGMLPVLLRFRNLSRAVLESKKEGLRTFLEEETHCALAPDGQQSPGNELLSHSTGGLLWILDGLDEVIDPGARKIVAGWIRQALKDRPLDWFLVTCRFQGYFRDGVPLGSEFAEFHVRPLDDQQVERFVRDWFAAAFKKLLGPGAQAEARAAADSEKLLEILALPAYQTGRIRELSTNPLLLTILCIVFHEERKLPTGRAELYSHCIRVFLETWRHDLYESDQGIVVQPYDARAAQDVLGRLAWWMHQEQNRTAAPLVDLAAEAAKGLVDVAASSGLGRDGGAFLERMRDETGILALGGEGDGRCGFLHLSFQEYLAAEHAASQGFAKELAARASESWWREVALLSLRSSQPFCEKFFVEMLAAGIAENHPDLAERCLTEARYVVLAPFLEALQQSPSDKRLTALLRLLRDRVHELPLDQMTPLKLLCRRLTDPANTAGVESRGFGAEILARLGIAPPRPVASWVFIGDRTGIMFVKIPAGEFFMGGNRGVSWENPIHQVSVTQGFWLAKYPVTNAQYGRFLEAAVNNVEKPSYWDDPRYNQPEQPVVGVSWNEARAFCEWVGGRLPTEAEWEYACRAGTTTEYCFGDDAKRLGEYAWFSMNSGGQTQPVGAKKSNAWDLHDMHGNVCEWCADWFGEFRAEPVSNPSGPESGSFRLIRGGCWLAIARNCRSPSRDWLTPGARFEYLGFRVAQSAVQ